MPVKQDKLIGTKPIVDRRWFMRKSLIQVGSQVAGNKLEDSDPLPNRREESRVTLLLRTAKLIVDDREFLCVVHDASSKGAKIHLFHPIPRHRNLMLELGNSNNFPATLVWQEGDFAGIHFEGPVDIRALVHERFGKFPKRQVRLRVNLSAEIRAGSEILRAKVTNISQQGMCVELEKSLRLKELVEIRTAVLPTLYAKVCWRKHGVHGLIFEQTFRLDELAQRLSPENLLRAAERARTLSGP